MFRWHKEIERLNIPAQQVVRLQRSINDVQVALPGLPAQKATAYLCVFHSGSGVRSAVALHLRNSRRVAFYLRESGESRPQDLQRLLDEGSQFAESMGFLLGDLDIHLLEGRNRAQLWDSLPLKSGDASAVPPATRAPASPPGPTKETVSSAPAEEEVELELELMPEAEAEPEIEPEAEPEDLLGPAAAALDEAEAEPEAILSPPASEKAVTASAEIPAAEEEIPTVTLEEQKERLRRSLGRLLASL